MSHDQTFWTNSPADHFWTILACLTSAAAVEITVGTNPQHSIEGLGGFSHVWLIFLFDKNLQGSTPKAKVYPPRLHGESTGVFASRSPHRPNPIGLTLCKLEHIQGSELTLSGVDLVSGTPILDVKPYIPSYDAPQGEVRSPEWASPIMTQALDVKFSAEAERQLGALGERGVRPGVMLSWEGVKQAVTELLSAGACSFAFDVRCPLIDSSIFGRRIIRGPAFTLTLVVGSL